MLGCALAAGAEIGWEWVHIGAAHLLTSLLFFFVQRKMTSPVVTVALTVSLMKGPRREAVLRLRGSQKHSSRTGSALSLIHLCTVAGSQRMHGQAGLLLKQIKLLSSQELLSANNSVLQYLLRGIA